jgi:peptidoglycan/LPS O-acetylase OafA/YrhL
VAAECFRVAFVISGAPGEVNYVLLPTRMDTLAVGAFLACAARSPELLAKISAWRTFMVGASILALLSILAVEHTVDFQRSLTQLIGYSAIAVISGIAILYAVRSQGWLTARPLRFIGRYSYAMYIWHGAVITLLARTSSFGGVKIGWASSLPSYALFVTLVILATIGTSLLSWSIIERPFLHMKRLVPYA